jgi:hypothetical protein
MSSLLPFTVAEVAPAELNLVRHSWLKGSHWQRAKMLRALEDGVTLVARSEGVVLGWMCVRDGAVCHAYTKEPYRQLGVCRALWEAHGMPRGLDEPATRVGKRLHRRVLEEL